MNNRRKYDRTSVHDLLVIHEEEDVRHFESIGKRLSRIECAMYGLYIALGLFVFLIDHPRIIDNLTSPAHAEVSR